MAAFVFDAMQVNVAFQSALSNDIVDDHPELWSGMRFVSWKIQLATNWQ